MTPSVLYEFKWQFYWHLLYGILNVGTKWYDCCWTITRPLCLTWHLWNLAIFSAVNRSTKRPLNVESTFSTIGRRPDECDSFPTPALWLVPQQCSFVLGILKVYKFIGGLSLAYHSVKPRVSALFMSSPLLHTYLTRWPSVRVNSEGVNPALSDDSLGSVLQLNALVFFAFLPLEPFKLTPLWLPLPEWHSFLPSCTLLGLQSLVSLDYGTTPVMRLVVDLSAKTEICHLTKV